MVFTKIASYLKINPAQTQTPAITPVSYGEGYTGKTVGLSATLDSFGDGGRPKFDAALLARLDAYDYPLPDRSGTYTKQFLG